MLRIGAPRYTAHAHALTIPALVLHRAQPGKTDTRLLFVHARFHGRCHIHTQQVKGETGAAQKKSMLTQQPPAARRRTTCGQQYPPTHAHTHTSTSTSTSTSTPVMCAYTRSQQNERSPWHMWRCAIHSKPTEVQDCAILWTPTEARHSVHSIATRARVRGRTHHQGCPAGSGSCTYEPHTLATNNCTRSRTCINDSMQA